jgi:hypothetical protein
MNVSLDPLQTMLIFRLVFTGESPKLSELQPRLTPVNRRDELVRAGLIRLEKRGRTTHVTATAKARDWTGRHLTAAFSARSNSVAPTLKAALEKMHDFMCREGVLFDAFLRAGPRRGNGVITTKKDHQVFEQEDSAHEIIRSAYAGLTGGYWNTRVRLADLRDQLSELPREVLDRYLLAMQQTGRLALYSLDDPREVTEADRDAALSILGHHRHIVYMSDG